MAYLLSAIDIKTRTILGWMLQHSIRMNDVVSLIRAIAAWYCLTLKITFRIDNGAQFGSKIGDGPIRTKCSIGLPLSS
jgi:transposase InsO family protein